jgi:hypothetical protein
MMPLEECHNIERELAGEPSVCLLFDQPVFRREASASGGGRGLTGWRYHSGHGEKLLNYVTGPASSKLLPQPLTSFDQLRSSHRGNLCLAMRTR